MPARLAASADVAQWPVVTAALLLSLCGCSARDAITAGVIAAPLAATAIADKPDDSGRFTAYLSDGRVLEGTWNTVSRPEMAADVTVETPRGRVTAAELGAPDGPAFTGELEGPRVRMICAFVGDHHSGFACHCADNGGTAWSGTFQGRNWLVKGYYSSVSVSLHEER